MIRQFLLRGATLLLGRRRRRSLAISDPSDSHPAQILIYIDLPQDLDMLLPLARRLQKSLDHHLTVAVSDKARNDSPRIETLLRATGIVPKVVSHQGLMAGLRPQFGNIRAVITASESTTGAHRGAYTLTQQAIADGLLTYTMQHGYENVGLNYFDEKHPVGETMFTSDTFFTWGPVEHLPAETPAETRAKCVAVGCPKFVDAPGLMAQVPGRNPGDRLVVVFENLHWKRYSDSYRQRFVDDLEAAALAHPDTTFLVKPHHIGLWFTEGYGGEALSASNLVVADPKLPEWEVFTAPALIEIADAVITTPSTVAIDAVRARCPVAVVAYDLDLPNFEPLPLLHSQNDWQAIAEKADGRSEWGVDVLQAFEEARLLPGDAVGRIMDRVSADMANADMASQH